MILLSSGAFVIAAAIIRVVLTLSASPSALTINGWGVRETIVGIITVNIPVLRPMFRRSFWTGNGSHAGPLRTTTAGGKATIISGSYELTPSINDGALGFRTRDRTSAEGSQESIVGKREMPSAVTVRTSYEISSARDPNYEDGWHGGKGENETSVKAGSRNM